MHKVLELVTIKTIDVVYSKTSNLHNVIVSKVQNVEAEQVNKGKLLNYNLLEEGLNYSYKVMNLPHLSSPNELAVLCVNSVLVYEEIDFD